MIIEPRNRDFYFILFYHHFGYQFLASDIQLLDIHCQLIFLLISPVSIFQGSMCIFYHEQGISRHSMTESLIG